MFGLGYLSLFLASFLAATVVPFSSEALLSGMVYGDFNLYSCILIATLGNTLGGVTTYYLGYLGKEQWLAKYFKISTQKVEKIKTKISGKEQWIAFFCWLPVIGDIIAAALGFLKFKLYLVVLGMFLGKGLRYGILGYLTYSVIFN